MTRTTRTTRIGVALLALATVLTGCTARPAAAPAAGAIAAPAAAVRFTCPTREEVAALTAVPFSTASRSGSGCDYATSSDDTEASTVRLRHGDTKAPTLAAVRAAAVARGEATADVPALAFDAFTTATAEGCTAWFPAVDGALSSVTARRSGQQGAAACDLASAVATLAGAGTPDGSTVVVVAASHLLGTDTADEAWPWRIGKAAGVRVDRVTGTGYLHPSRPTSLAGRAAQVPTGSAAVVLVTGTEEAGVSRLQVLAAATAALSAAAARAPHARLIVVGPVADGTSDASSVETLRTDLRSAAGIAGATYVEPVVGASAPDALSSTADQVVAALRTDGIATG